MSAKDQIIEAATSPQVSVPAYLSAAVLGSLGDISLLLQIAALIGAVLLIFAHALRVRNEWLEGRKLKLEIKNAGGGDD